MLWSDHRQKLTETFILLSDYGKPLPDGGNVAVTANKGGKSNLALAARRITEKIFQTVWQILIPAEKGIIYTYQCKWGGDWLDT